MGELINLRQARKARARLDKANTAQANRAVHGRTKAEKDRDEIERVRLARAVDQARLDPSD